MRLSIIIPALNEAPGIVACLRRLQPLRAAGHEIIVVDAGSTDATCALARPLADSVIPAPRGRARQMNAGARQATGDALIFLHADTILPARAELAVTDALARNAAGWGRFDVRLSGSHPMFRVIESLMNLRSRVTGIATGDQAMFVRREAFAAAGGFPDLALMEDVAMSRRLRRRGRPACLRLRVVTSSRRWEQHGIARTIAMMWFLRLAFWIGADPGWLARCYERG